MNSMIVLLKNRLILKSCNDMVIVTAHKPKGPNLPSKRPFSSVYEAAKYGLKTSGYYQQYDLERYDPDVLYKKHVGKYTYKPRKRLAGYVGQKIYGFPKKIKYSSRGFKQKFNGGNCLIGYKYSNHNCR